MSKSDPDVDHLPAAIDSAFSLVFNDCNVRKYDIDRASAFSGQACKRRQF